MSTLNGEKCAVHAGMGGDGAGGAGGGGGRSAQWLTLHSQRPHILPVFGSGGHVACDTQWNLMYKSRLQY